MTRNAFQTHFKRCSKMLIFTFRFCKSCGRRWQSPLAAICRQVAEMSNSRKNNRHFGEAFSSTWFTQAKNKEISVQHAIPSWLITFLMDMRMSPGFRVLGFRILSIVKLNISSHFWLIVSLFQCQQSLCEKIKYKQFDRVPVLWVYVEFEFLQFRDRCRQIKDNFWQCLCNWWGHGGASKLGCFTYEICIFLWPSFFPCSNQCSSQVMRSFWCSW